MPEIPATRRYGAEDDLRVSFEFFPPKNEIGGERLRASIAKLAPLDPRFVSVTYGAGGSTRERSLDVVRRLHNETKLPVAAHLTCVGASRSTLNCVIDAYVSSGITRFVALRGDPPAGVGQPYLAHPDGYANGADLTAALARRGDFDISVSAYPERHPESRDFSVDIELLKRKMDAGAKRAITQFFFDNDVFERYVERVRRAGITIPVVAGILPVHNFPQVVNFASRCGANIPGPLASHFEKLENDPQTHALVSATVAAEQVIDLMERGVRDFHFYTMNRADLVFAVCHLIGIRPRVNTGTDTAAA